MSRLDRKSSNFQAFVLALWQGHTLFWEFLFFPKQTFKSITYLGNLSPSKINVHIWITVGVNSKWREKYKNYALSLLIIYRTVAEKAQISSLTKATISNIRCSKWEKRNHRWCSKQWWLWSAAQASQKLDRQIYP